MDTPSNLTPSDLQEIKDLIIYLASNHPELDLIGKTIELMKAYSLINKTQPPVVSMESSLSPKELINS
ncbi:hypothetical protein BHC44_08915 [Snodgrassella alvi]|nr:hypothetical protein [Gilliamella sp.]PIT52339.1 hypothetical protein BHC44_08915 [Snodgrassella alvi]